MPKIKHCFYNYRLQNSPFRMPKTKHCFYDYRLQNSPFGLIVALFFFFFYNYVYVSLSDIHFGNAKVADELMSAGTQVAGQGT